MGARGGVMRILMRKFRAQSPRCSSHAFMMSRWTGTFLIIVSPYSSGTWSRSARSLISFLGNLAVTSEDLPNFVFLAPVNRAIAETDHATIA